MRYIPLLDNKPSDDWCVKADNLTQNLMDESNEDARKKLIDKNTKIWGEIKKHLLDISHGKCWYSEARDVYSHWHVDHFRPKKSAINTEKTDEGGYWWLAFEWKNYRISGSVGNTKKGDRFAVHKYKANSPDDSIEDEIIYFLDPIDEDDPMLLVFDENGMVKPINPNEDDWEYKRAKYTIDNLKLNYQPLKEARREVWKNCIELISEINTLLIELNKNPSITTKTRIKEKQEKLRTYIKEKAQFSATALSCLTGSGITWAQKIANRI